ncbi:MAG: DUF2905 domain-containing protein [Dehalococcoidia bacterium]|nr:DUF2905 domain-containing protein [Dehalococcoidia bacterium]
MEGTGKILLIVGGVIIVLGLLLVFGQHIPFLGKLPGDILIKKDGFTFYFPVVTLLIVSILLTTIISVILHFLSR